MAEGEIQVGDLIGDLHGHTSQKDGSGSWDSTIDDEKAVQWVGQGNIKIQYFTLSQHAEGFDDDHQLETFHDQPNIFAQEKQRTEELNQRSPDLKVIFGMEVSIRKDGSVNFSDELMSQPELVVASVHTDTDDTPDSLTIRIIKALNSPYVDIIGHPGRGSSNWQRIDWLRISQEAAKLDKAIEVSMQPTAHYSKGEGDRPEPSRQLEVLKALQQGGAKISIGTDIHHSPEIEEGKSLRFGQVRDLVELVRDLNSAGFTKDRIINSYRYEDLIRWAKDNNGR